MTFIYTLSVTLTAGILFLTLGYRWGKNDARRASDQD